MIGETISRYKIVEVIGTGGMGIVYAADDPGLGRRVAIKLLDTATDEPIYRTRFRREARAISSLKHPNIATVFDFGETETGRPYLVMELVEGKTLTELLDGGELTLAAAVDVIVEVALALSAAHAKGIIHRDIKPSNIMVSDTGQVKVLDFGLAKQMGEAADGADEGGGNSNDHKTQTGIVVGTPLYLSPEQATSRQVDGRSDLFSLGAVLYECLAGRQPFYGRNALEIGGQVIHVHPPAPSAVNPEVPPELDRITLKALAKDPGDRYQTAAVLASELKAARNELEGMSAAAPRRRVTGKETNTVTRLLALTQTVRRKRVSVGTLLIGGVLLIAAVWGIQRYFRKSLHQPAPAVIALVEEGTALLRNGETQRARTVLEQAVKADPDYALAHARLAEVLVDLDSTDLASRELLKANQLVPDRTALPRAEALYIESLSASISNYDYASAVAAYREIVRLSPNDAKAHVDLGRALEKAYETTAAIDAFRRATEIDPKYATAYLRLGILYTRKRDLGSASEVFARAEALFKEMGNNREGQTEVFEKRGLLFRENARSADALEQFKQALALAQETGNVSQQVNAWLDISSAQLVLGALAPAELAASEGIELAQKNDLRTLVISGLISLARVQTSKREVAEAERNLLQARDLAHNYNARYREQSAVLNLAALKVQQGQLEDGLQLALGALEFFERVNYRSSISACLTTIGRAERQLGNFETALKHLQRRLQLEQEADNQYEIAATHGDIGSVLREMERYPEALTNFDRNYEIHKAGGFMPVAGYAQGNRAEILWRLGRYDQARQALTEVFAIAKEMRSDRGLMDENLRSEAEMELSRSNTARALQLAGQVLKTANGQINAIVIKAQIVDGLAKSRSGAVAPGIAMGRSALANARSTNNVPLAEDASLALAESLYLGGKMDEAAELAKQLGESSARANQHETEWRAWLWAANANGRLGHRELADGQRALSSAALTRLRSDWGEAVFLEYRSRPDILASIKSQDGVFAAVSTSK